MPSDTYMTEDEFCTHYLVSPRTAQRWRQNGDGPAWCRFGMRRVVYRMSDCESWAAARTFQHRAGEIAASRLSAARP